MARHLFAHGHILAQQKVDKESCSIAKKLGLTKYIYIYIYISLLHYSRKNRQDFSLCCETPDHNKIHLYICKKIGKHCSQND